MASLWCVSICAQVVTCVAVCCSVLQCAAVCCSVVTWLFVDSPLVYLCCFGLGCPCCCLSGCCQQPLVAALPWWAWGCRLQCTWVGSARFWAFAPLCCWVLLQWGWQCGNQQCVVSATKAGLGCPVAGQMWAGPKGVGLALGICAWLQVHQPPLAGGQRGTVGACCKWWAAWHCGCMLQVHQPPLVGGQRGTVGACCKCTSPLWWVGSMALWVHAASAPAPFGGWAVWHCGWWLWANWCGCTVPGRVASAALGLQQLPMAVLRLWAVVWAWSALGCLALGGLVVCQGGWLGGWLGASCCGWPRACTGIGLAVVPDPMLCWC